LRTASSADARPVSRAQGLDAKNYKIRKSGQLFPSRSRTLIEERLKSACKYADEGGKHSPRGQGRPDKRKTKDRVRSVDFVSNIELLVVDPVAAVRKTHRCILENILIHEGQVFSRVHLGRMINTLREVESTVKTLCWKGSYNF